MTSQKLAAAKRQRKSNQKHCRQIKSTGRSQSAEAAQDEEIKRQVKERSMAQAIVVSAGLRDACVKLTFLAKPARKGSVRSNNRDYRVWVVSRSLGDALGFLDIEPRLQGIEAVPI